MGYPSFASRNIHCFVGDGVMKEGFIEDLWVECSGYLFDFGEEG